MLPLNTINRIRVTILETGRLTQPLTAQSAAAHRVNTISIEYLITLRRYDIDLSKKTTCLVLTANDLVKSQVIVSNY